MNYRRFLQARMKKCQVVNEEMEAELMQDGVQDFRYGIAKIWQGLRNFCSPSEISLWPYFRYDSENSLS